MTFPGAFHHCTNRGHGKERILAGDGAKGAFLEILADSAKRLKIRVLAYCLMDSHYHLVVENSSGRLSDFFKLLNGEYGILYRKRYGGTGYVFQGRYKSTLIQDEGYLLTAISYVLGNPVRAKLAKSFRDYPWSSAALYFRKDSADWIDCNFVEGLYGTEASMSAHVRSWEAGRMELSVIHTKFGPLLADDARIGELQERCDRRSGRESAERKRQDDSGFEPVEKIYREWRLKHGIDQETIDFNFRHGQQLRRELLLHLKDRAGLKYREIARLPEFAAVKMNALGSLYRYEKGKNS